MNHKSYLFKFLFINWWKWKWLSLMISLPCSTFCNKDQNLIAASKLPNTLFNSPEKNPQLLKSQLSLPIRRITNSWLPHSKLDFRNNRKSHKFWVMTFFLIRNLKVSHIIILLEIKIINKIQIHKVNSIPIF